MGTIPQRPKAPPANTSKYGASGVEIAIIMGWLILGVLFGLTMLFICRG